MLPLLFLSALAAAANANPSGQVKHHVLFQKIGGSMFHNTYYDIFCNNCTIEGDIILSAGCNTATCQQQPNEAFSSLPFSFGSMWTAALFEDFVVHFDINMTLREKEGLGIPLPWDAIPDAETQPQLGAAFGVNLPFKWNDTFDLNYNFNPIFYISANGTAQTSFRYGFDLVPPSGKTAVYIPQTGPVAITGFSQSVVNPLIYQSSDSNADFNLTFGVEPAMLATGTINDVALRNDSVQLSVPYLNLGVSQVFDVDRNCKPHGTFKQLTQVFTKVSYFWYYTFVEGTTNGTTHSNDLGSEHSLPSMCLNSTTGSMETGSPKANGGARLGRPALSVLGIVFLGTGAFASGLGVL